MFLYLKPYSWKKNKLLAPTSASIPLVNTSHVNTKTNKILCRHERDARASRKTIVMIQLITKKHPKKQQ